MPTLRSLTAALPLLCLVCWSRADDTVLRALISRADLDYPAPPVRSEDGLPVGNGRMGSLIWTTPTAVKLQINRVDVQPISAATNSFPERNSDYMGGCGFVDLDLGAAGDDVFVAENCPQHLSVYDALATVHGRGAGVRVVALPDVDVMAIELDDSRPSPLPLTISLRMLRSAPPGAAGNYENMVREHQSTVRTRNHLATSQLHIRGDRILLTQEFAEGAHVAKSVVAIALLGRSAKPRFANETTVQLATPAAQGQVVVLIASAATLSPDEDIAAKALHALDSTLSRGTGILPVRSASGADGHGQSARATHAFNALAADTAAWWHAFWARGSLDLHSPDGIAEYVADNYHYYLYQMAATSRGKFPPKFNGLLWNTAGDLRTWGAQHWFANLSCYYEALFASNRLELLDPMFDMYSGMFDACATAARQQWGSDGIFIPETVWYDGLAPLPDDIATEMRDLYLLRKPWSERSAPFIAFAATKNPHSSRWNWIGGGSYVGGVWTPVPRETAPFGPVTHNLATTAKVAYLFWRRYEYTLDREWLRTRAYPMLRGAAELYHHFPNFRRDPDGIWHIHHTNSNESLVGVRDSDEDISAMRGAFSAAIRAADILATDAPLRAQWREILDHLAPLPASNDPDAIKPADYQGPNVFVRGRTPATGGRGFTPDGNSLPQWFFDLCNLDSTDATTLAAANATFDRSVRGPLTASTPVGVLSKQAIAAAALGRAEAVRFLIPNQIRSLTAERGNAYRGGQPLMNRLALREGVQAFDCQRLGRAAEALELALLNSAPTAPAGDPILRLFAAWPADWEATFTLRARGGFVVTAAKKAGRVEFVEIRSEAGAPLRLHNPWPGSSVEVQRSLHPPLQTNGDILRLETGVGETLRLFSRTS